MDISNHFSSPFLLLLLLLLGAGCASLDDSFLARGPAVPM